MAAPDTSHNPNSEIKSLVDEKVADADLAPDYIRPNSDLEKGGQSAAISTHSDERTLGEEEPSQELRDPDVVDWDGPNDPENPLNWPEGRKWGLIACLGAVTLVTYV